MAIFVFERQGLVCSSSGSLFCFFLWSGLSGPSTLVFCAISLRLRLCSLAGSAELAELLLSLIIRTGGRGCDLAGGASGPGAC